MPLSFNPFLEAYVRTSLIYTPSCHKCTGYKLRRGQCMCKGGGHLAVINDTAKLNVIQSKLKSLSNFRDRAFWTGIYTR